MNLDPTNMERNSKMARHEIFIERLKELGMYDKDSDYNGMIGKCVEELSKTFSNQGHSGTSAETTLQLFNQLIFEYGCYPVNIGLCRKIIVKIFENAPDFYQIYIDNVACMLIDETQMKTEIANKIADLILKRIFND